MRSIWINSCESHIPRTLQNEQIMSQAATKNFLDGCSLQQDEKEAGLTL